jgi:hypothetical protein
MDDDIVAKLVELQKQRGVSFKDIVNQTLRLGLEQTAKLAHVPKFTVKARPMGQRPGLNYDNIGELLEQIEDE